MKKMFLLFLCFITVCFLIGCVNADKENCIKDDNYRSITNSLNKSFYIISLENEKVRVSFDEYIERNPNSRYVYFEHIWDSMQVDYRNIKNYISEYSNSNVRGKDEYIELKDKLNTYYNITINRTDTVYQTRLKNMVDSMQLTYMENCDNCSQAYQEMLISHTYLSVLLIYTYSWRSSLSLTSTDVPLLYPFRDCVR